MNYSNVHNLEKCRCAEEMCVISMSCQAQLTFLSDVTASQSGRDSEGRERGPGSCLNIYLVTHSYYMCTCVVNIYVCTCVCVCVCVCLYEVNFSLTSLPVTFFFFGKKRRT